MIGFGWSEMMVMGIVALIFIGPKEFLQSSIQIGKLLGKMHRMTGEFRRELEAAVALDEVTETANALRQPFVGAARDFNQSLHSSEALSSNGSPEKDASQTQDQRGNPDGGDENFATGTNTSVSPHQGEQTQYAFHAWKQRPQKREWRNPIPEEYASLRTSRASRVETTELSEIEVRNE